MTAIPEPPQAGERVDLRPVLEQDLPVLFEHQLDDLARHRVAFAAEDSSDRASYLKRWRGHLVDGAIVMRAILVDGELAGHVVGFERDGEPEVGYWLARPFWGRGIATRALGLFLSEHGVRPLQARVAADNHASLRVLEKCGFRPLRSERSYSNVRGVEIEERILILTDRWPVSGADPADRT